MQQDIASTCCCASVVKKHRALVAAAVIAEAGAAHLVVAVVADRIDTDIHQQRLEGSPAMPIVTALVQMSAVEQ